MAPLNIFFSENFPGSLNNFFEHSIMDASSWPLEMNILNENIWELNKISFQIISFKLEKVF